MIVTRILQILYIYIISHKDLRNLLYNYYCGRIEVHLKCFSFKCLLIVRFIAHHPVRSLIANSLYIVWNCFHWGLFVMMLPSTKLVLRYWKFPTRCKFQQNVDTDTDIICKRYWVWKQKQDEKTMMMIISLLCIILFWCRLVGLFHRK